MLTSFGVFGAILLACGIFIVVWPDRYTVWRRRRQPETLRMLETRSVTDERPSARTNGWSLLLLGAGLLVVAISRAGPASWYTPGILIFAGLGLLVFIVPAISVLGGRTSPRQATSDEILTVYNRIRASQGLPEVWDSGTKDEIAAAMSGTRAHEVHSEHVPRLGFTLRWSKVWGGIVVLCGLVAILGRTVYPLAANHFGYALPGDAFGDLPGHVTYAGLTYTNPSLCDGLCRGQSSPSCYSANDLRRAGQWPLAQVTGIPSLPGPIRQVYAIAYAGSLPGDLYVYAGTYHCYVAYNPAGTVLFGNSYTIRSAIVYMGPEKSVFHLGETVALVAYLSQSINGRSVTRIISGGKLHVKRVQVIHITGTPPFATIFSTFNSQQVQTLFPATGTYQWRYVHGRTVLATGTVTILR